MRLRFYLMKAKFVLSWVKLKLLQNILIHHIPDYRKLIPENTDIALELTKSEILRVTKLAALFAREVGGSIILETDKSKGCLMVSSVANEFGENTSEIEVDVEKDEKVIFNSRYILDALNALTSEKIKFEIFWIV